jgi:hypothetical protein
MSRYQFTPQALREYRYLTPSTTLVYSGFRQ